MDAHAGGSWARVPNKFPFIHTTSRKAKERDILFHLPLRKVLLPNRYPLSIAASGGCGSKGMRMSRWRPNFLVQELKRCTGFHFFTTMLSVVADQAGYYFYCRWYVQDEYSSVQRDSFTSVLLVRSTSGRSPRP
jgi:hypothetical protein